ncbi:MAG: biotin/lipoyl-containing protein [Halobacteriota archaeon]|nr:biotin/lipoyl-containing protein [Halobacteriota archaeon]
MTPNGRIRRFRVEIDGKVHEVKVEEISDRSVIREIKREVDKPPEESETSSRKMKEKKGEVYGTITSPMQGTVLKINVKEGDKVKEGDVLVILEAMKMENEIISEVLGVVEEVYVSESEAVNAGTVLLKVKKS